MNAALILDKKPAIGIITAPAKKRIFYSYGLSNSYELIDNQEIELINKKKEYSEIKALTYSNEIRSDILEIHQKNNDFTVCFTVQYAIILDTPRHAQIQSVPGRIVSPALF